MYERRRGGGGSGLNQTAESQMGLLSADLKLRTDFQEEVLKEMLIEEVVLLYFQNDLKVYKICSLRNNDLTLITNKTITTNRWSFLLKKNSDFL